MTVELLTEQYLEFLSLIGGCTGSSESTLVKCHIVGKHMLCLNYNFVKSFYAMHDVKCYKISYIENAFSSIIFLFNDLN